MRPRFSRSGFRSSPRRFITRSVTADLKGKTGFAEVSLDKRWEVRTSILELDGALAAYSQAMAPRWTEEQRRRFEAMRLETRQSIDYVPDWIIVAVALCLGLGGMVGWKRVVVTVGEKIGKDHLTYGQGVSAQLVGTIGLADVEGLPVSTTHVLSSGVAGSASASGTGLNPATVRSILLAWVLTLPASILLSSLLLLIGRQIVGA
ncbi:MAG: inorganic phosphate transporter [Planctomycetes bacterium]|nr:inorganic phosphate transporter [Planctomycetota bacterium]